MVKHIGSPHSTSSPIPDPAPPPENESIKATPHNLAQAQAILSHLLLSQRNATSREGTHSPSSNPNPNTTQPISESEHDHDDDASGIRAARAGSVNISETLRHAAQAELLRMRALQDQQRRRSTSAAHQLPTVRAGSRLVRQTPIVTPLGPPVLRSPQTTGHKRQWEDTVHSQQFLEQAGAVAHQFGEFFSQERAWAGLALEAATRRDSELSTSEGRTEASRASISTVGSRASLSIQSQASASSGTLSNRLQPPTPPVTSEDMPPPLKRLRITTSRSEASLMLPPPSSPEAKETVHSRHINEMPSIVRSSPTPSSESRSTTRPSEVLHSVVSTQRSRILTPSSAAARALSSPNLSGSPQHGGSPRGLVTVLSNFAQMLEGRQQVSRGLEALAREGHQFVRESGAGAEVSVESEGTDADRDAEVIQHTAGASPSAESEDGHLSASASEWTDSSQGDMLGVGPSSRRATLCSTSSRDGSRRLSEVVDAEAPAVQAEAQTPPSHPVVSGFAAMKRRSRSASPGLSCNVFQSRGNGPAHHLTASSVFFSEAESVEPRTRRDLKEERAGSPTSSRTTSSSTLHVSDVRPRSGRHPIVSGWCAWRVHHPRNRSNRASRTSIAVAPDEPAPTSTENKEEESEE
ncbi:hypothetical protein OC845_000864 [Tilletia horrida]|nr:hypothetical protein OC845_000864 [Tilletia horrida]